MRYFVSYKIDLCKIFSKKIKKIAAYLLINSVKKVKKKRNKSGTILQKNCKFIPLIYDKLIINGEIHLVV